MMEVVVTTEAIRHAKLQSDCHHQQTNTQLFTGCVSFLSPNQQRHSTEGNEDQCPYYTLITCWTLTSLWNTQAVCGAKIDPSKYLTFRPLSGVTGDPCHGIPSCQFSASCALPFSTLGQARDKQTDRRTDRQTDGQSTTINTLHSHPLGAEHYNYVTGVTAIFPR